MTNLVVSEANNLQESFCIEKKNIFFIQGTMGASLHLDGTIMRLNQAVDHAEWKHPH